MNKNSLSKISCRDKILFVGAGFSASVGGYLATQMWEELLLSPEIAQISELLEVVKNPDNQFDYEKIYHSVLNSDEFSLESKEAMQKAIERAYINHNKHVMDDSVGKRINYKWLRAFLKSFASQGESQGFVFTTNQDLFFENLTRLIAGVPSDLIPHGHHNKITLQEFARFVGLHSYGYANSTIDLNTNSNFDEMIEKYWEFWSNKRMLHIVKLHGSWGWQSSLKKYSEMVVGVNKKEHIHKIPLLKYYLELFEEVLCTFKGKLLVIGYGFNDQHVNDVIIKGINNGLELHVINPARPKDFYHDLEQKDILKIWDGLTGYYPYQLQELFPPNHNVITSKDRIGSLLNNFRFKYDEI